MPDQCNLIKIRCFLYLSLFVLFPGLAPGLRICLSEAKDTVPEDKYSATPVYLGATAGMRY
jgi:hypothetical protein